MVIGSEPHAVILPATDSRLDDPIEAVDHLVCCRRPWDAGGTTLCGAEIGGDEYVSLMPDRICPLCVEQALRRLAAFGIAFPTDPPFCPWDGRSCPSEQEIDRRIDEHLQSGGDS
jgi:hypothetical protein